MLDRLIQAFQASGAGKWYASKEPGEQKIVLAIAVLAVLSLGWSAAWKPVSDWQTAEVARFDTSRTALDFLKRNESAARKAASQNRAGGGRRSLLPIVSRSADTAGVKLSRFQPEDSGAVSVVLQAQPFDDVMRWIHNLERNNQVRVF